MISAALNSSSIKEFNDQGNWKTVGATLGGALIGGTAGYYISESSKVKYPGNNPEKCEAPGFEWRGDGTVSSGKGNFVNMQTGEWLHPDLQHGPPIGPHWDYGIRGSKQVYRIFPDGRIFLK